MAALFWRCLRSFALVAGATCKFPGNMLLPLPSYFRCDPATGGLMLLKSGLRHYAKPPEDRGAPMPSPPAGDRLPCRRLCDPLPSPMPSPPAGDAIPSRA